MFPSAYFLQEQKLASLKQLLLLRKFRRETLKIFREVNRAFIFLFGCLGLNILKDFYKERYEYKKIYIVINNIIYRYVRSLHN